MNQSQSFCGNFSPVNMYRIVAFLVCVGTAAASLCCVPPQWEGEGDFITTIVHNGVPHVSTGYVQMAYDAVQRRIGQYEYITIGGQPERVYGVLMDFNSNTKYMINEQRTCYKQRLNRMPEDFGGCIPDNATVVRSNDVVGLGSNHMNLKTYRLAYPSVVAYATLTADTCVPVVEVIRGQLENNNFLQNNHYYNITAGLSAPENLQVPPVGCENAIMVDAHYQSSSFLSSIGKRSSFLGL